MPGFLLQKRQKEKGTLIVNNMISNFKIALYKPDLKYIYDQLAKISVSEDLQEIRLIAAQISAAIHTDQIEPGCSCNTCAALIGEHVSNLQNHKVIGKPHYGF